MLPINPNIGTSIRFKPSQKTEKQEKQLSAISNFIKEEALNRLAEALKSKTGGDYLTDSQGLSQIFHEHGVNMRYLGQLYEHEALKDAIEVKICLCRGILVRSLKHIFRDTLKEVSPCYLSSTIAHLLNCIFASYSQIEYLSQSSEPK